MKLIYYSCYSYEADDFKVVDNPNGRGDALDMPFRLYKAAECEGDFDDVPEFIMACWEVMDMPSCKNVDDIHKPYTLKHYDGTEVKVTPTKYFYGATNSCDGVYVVNNKYYIIKWSDVVWCPSFEDAFNEIAQKEAKFYLKGDKFDIVEK